MAVIANLDVLLGARTEKYDAGLDRATKRAKDLRGDLNSAVGGELFQAAGQSLDSLVGRFPGVSQGVGAFQSITSSVGSLGPAGIAAGVAVGGALAGIAAGGAAAAYSIGQIRNAMAEIDATTDAAHRLGMSFHEVVVARRSLGETSGLDDGAIDASMQKLQLNLREASKGSGDLHELLSNVGVDAGQLLETGPVEQMKVLSAAMQEMKNPADQMNLAMELFGKQGVALVASLREGPEHMAEMERHTIAWGLSLSDTQAEQVGAANDAWQQVTDIATGAWRQIAAEVSPVLTVIAEEIMAFAGPLEGWNTGLSFVVDGFVSVTGWVYDLYEVVTLTHSVMQKLVTLDFSGVGDSIESALSFDTADKWQAKINDARRAASEAAENAVVTRGFESQAEEIEKQKEAAKEVKKAAEETRKAEEEARKAAERAAEEKRKAEEQAQERLDDHLNKIREEIEMAREIARLRTEGFSEADARRLTQQAKEINELITMGADGQLAASLVNERAQLEAEQRKLEQAQKDSETSVSATSAEVGSKEAYQIMIGARNDQLKEAQKQTSLQQQLVNASQEQTRAIQAISPMRAIR